MNLRRLERQLLWPEALPADRLAGWIRQQLQPDGHLLRWAITAVHTDSSGQRWLQLEAVVQVKAVLQVKAVVKTKAVAQIKDVVQS